MLCEFSERSYAKVNFGLNVLPLGKDAAFHNIESIFQTVNLYDELVVSKQNNLVCSVHCDSMELPEENTLTMAYKAFSKVTGKNDFGVHVELKKGIPSGGGLGGGSSNGASLIKILERFYGINLSQDQLEKIAGQIGSDVFFFTQCDSKGTGCALVSGRGEKVKKIEGRNDLFLVLVFPKVSSSTKLAYSLIDKMFERGERVNSPAFENYEKIYRLRPDQWTFVNTFTPVVSSEYEEIGQALKSVQKTGALFTDVSGSGSTVFGIYNSEQQAEKAKEMLAEDWSCKVCRAL